MHRHGKRYTILDLIEEATGKPFSADDFFDHATTKYGALYDL